MKQIPLHIPASKSISNRLLILRYLYPNIKIDNISSAKDTRILQEALISLKSDNYKNFINIGHAGTAMRFLTALSAILPEKQTILDGSSRMRQRPIKILVEALQQLGADIQYGLKQGFPPLHINGQKLTKSSITIDAGTSSQYITALMLIAAKLPYGLQINLQGQLVSLPYIQMTLQILKHAGIEAYFTVNRIQIKPATQLSETNFEVEGDWSSASYFYGILALLRNQKISLSPFLADSLQGDSQLVNYYKKLGITTRFLPDKQIELSPVDNFVKPDCLTFNLLTTPDLAQTLAVTCLGMGIKCRLTGLQTLRIKETDRLQAMQSEMQKLGAGVTTGNDYLEIHTPYIKQPDVIIKTYDDHRMAMSFAILQKIYPQLQIADKNVVIKSFPEFWQLFEQIN